MPVTAHTRALNSSRRQYAVGFSVAYSRQGGESREELNGIKAIETVYAGYRFRSRLEARWAVFFNHLRIPFEYESEGYDLGTVGWYLPDFWLPKQEHWVEIKPRLSAWKWPNDEILEKARRLEEGTGYGVWVICGSPGIPVEISSHDQNSYEGFISGDSNYYWCECKACGRIEMQWQATASRISCHCINSVYYNESTSRLLAAYNAARQARFGR